ncbi:MAG: hypothetical protein ACO29Z_06190, partial [Crocinitomicaceae bacterium]
DGCNALFKSNKAHLIYIADDLLTLLNCVSVPVPKIHENNLLNVAQKQVFELFGNKNTWSIDELAFHLQKPVSEISTLLFELELQSLIEHTGANRYKLPI